MEAELAGANRAEILRGRIEKLNTTILDRTTGKTVSDTAVDLGAIERLTGWTRQGVIEALALALIIELMSITLIAAAWRIRPWDHRLAPANPSVVETSKEEAGTVPAAPQEASKDVTDAPKSKPKKRTKKAAAGGRQTPSRGPSPKTASIAPEIPPKITPPTIPNDTTRLPDNVTVLTPRKQEAKAHLHATPAPLLNGGAATALQLSPSMEVIEAPASVPQTASGDHVRDFIETHQQRSPKTSLPAADLRAAYEVWCRRFGFTPETQTSSVDASPKPSP